MKKDKLFLTDIAVVGDSVEYEPNADGSGVIFKIDKRQTYISRKAPRIRGAGYRGERLEQIIASNIDSLFVVCSVSEPAFNNKTVDRLLIIGESAGLTPVIVINKIDLDEDNKIDYWVGLYVNIGYTVLKTSIITNEGIDKLRELLQGKINLFFGHSGVGKSSLLNRMYPELKLKVGSISSFTDKGTHTTVTSNMLKVNESTFVIDTPGIREIDPFGIRKEDVGHYFIEFPEYSSGCRFNTCTHDHEPGCAVIKSVEQGKIPAERYESYLKILETVEEDILF